MSAHGRFTWYDLMTTDPDAGKGFYTDLIGWGTQAWEGPTPYMMWTREEMPLGGLMQLPKEASDAGAPPHWLLYVAVDNVDETVAKAEELGASVYVPAQDVPDTGRFSVLADPEGAVFAVYQTLQEQAGGDEAPEVGQFSWHELMAENADTAFDFYTKLFGWAKGDAHDMGEMGIYQIFSRREGTVSVGGVFNKMPEMPAGWLVYIRVEDVEAAVAKVTELGGMLLNGPMDVPDGDRIAQCLDPQGAAFALHSTSA